MLCFTVASGLCPREYGSGLSLVLMGEMRIYSNEHVRKFSEAGTTADFCKPQLIWSVLGWCSYQEKVVTKEDVAPEAVADLGQC